jgi:hypothetical protein
VALLVEPVREIDVCLAIEQIAQIHTGPLEVNGVDLKITPVEGAVGVVVIDVAFALRVFDALNGERSPTIGAKFSASVLLISGERAQLVRLHMSDLFGFRAAAYRYGRLETKAQRRLEIQGVAGMDEDDAANQHCPTNECQTSGRNSEAFTRSVSAHLGRCPMKTPKQGRVQSDADHSLLVYSFISATPIIHLVALSCR